MGSQLGSVSSQQTRLDPGIKSMLDQALRGQSEGIQQFTPQAQQAAGQVQTGFAGLASPLNTEFKDPTQLDDRAKTLLGLQQQIQGQQAASARQQIGQQFQGQPGVARALQGQSLANQQLGANPLAFQAGAEQRERAIQNQTLTNQARQAQTEQGASLQQAGNAAIGQRFGIQSAPLQAQQNLVNSLGQIGQLTGKNVSGSGLKA